MTLSQSNGFIDRHHILRFYYSRFQSFLPTDLSNAIVQQLKPKLDEFRSYARQYGLTDRSKFFPCLIFMSLMAIHLGRSATQKASSMVFVSVKRRHFQGKNHREKTRCESQPYKVFFNVDQFSNDYTLRALAIVQLSSSMIENFSCTVRKTIILYIKKKLIEISQTILRVANAIALRLSSDDHQNQKKTNRYYSIILLV